MLHVLKCTCIIMCTCTIHVAPSMLFSLCYYSDIVASRDHVYVGDAVNGIALSINHTPKDNCNEIFDIGSGQKPVFMDTVFMLLTDAMTKKAQPVN